MILIKPIFFNGEKILNNKNLSFEYNESSIMNLFKELLMKTENLEHLLYPKFKGEKINIKNKKEKITINFIFIDKKELLDYWNAPEDAIGFHSISSGAYEKQDKDFIAKEHRVFLYFNEKEFQKNINKLPKENQKKYLKYYLSTITHEIAHCVEFIENSNGLTPKEVEDLIQNKKINVNLMDICSGNGTIFDYSSKYSYFDLEKIMEDRVEDKGENWLEEVKLSEEVINNIVKKITSTVKTKNKLKKT